MKRERSHRRISKRNPNLQFPEQRSAGRELRSQESHPSPRITGEGERNPRNQRKREEFGKKWKGN